MIYRLTVLLITLLLLTSCSSREDSFAWAPVGAIGVFYTSPIADYSVIEYPQCASYDCQVNFRPRFTVSLQQIRPTGHASTYGAPCVFAAAIVNGDGDTLAYAENVDGGTGWSNLTIDFEPEIELKAGNWYSLQMVAEGVYGVSVTGPPDDERSSDFETVYASGEWCQTWSGDPYTPDFNETGAIAFELMGWPTENWQNFTTD